MLYNVHVSTHTTNRAMQKNNANILLMLATIVVWRCNRSPRSPPVYKTTRANPLPRINNVQRVTVARWAHSPRHGGHPLLAPHRLSPQHRTPPPSGAFLVDPILFRFVDCFTSNFSLFTLQQGRNQKRLEYTEELRPAK